MKIKVKTNPVVELRQCNNGGDVLKLRREMVYFVGRRAVTVPKGFRCDGMSVPRALWGLVSPAIHPQTIAAAILHDWLYRTANHSLTRKQADWLFFLLMLKCKFSRWRSALAYLGVRLFGKKSWAKGREKNV